MFKYCRQSSLGCTSMLNMGRLLVFNDLIALHVDVELMTFPRFVHDLHLADALAIFVVTFDFSDKTRLSLHHRLDAGDRFVCREGFGWLACRCRYRLPTA